MSFQIQQGLFSLDFIDRHAILGVHVDADAKEIRKRYLKIARCLHPDSFATDNEVERQQATEILSKLVNPAYETLSQEKERVEYAVLLRLKGQQAVRQRDSIQVLSEVAKRLSAASDVEHSYKAGLQQLAEKQYETLGEILEITGQISELNLVYLIHKTGQQEAVRSTAKQTATSTSASPKSSAPTSPAAASTPAPAASPKVPLVEQYYRRAEGYMKENNLAKAILELREALQLEPNNARCHSLLGSIYLKQNQATMAKIHFNKALQLNPNDEIALKGKGQLEKAATQNTAQVAGQKAAKPKAGGFFGLFGDKKK